MFRKFFFDCKSPQPPSLSASDAEHDGYQREVDLRNQLAAIEDARETYKRCRFFNSTHGLSTKPCEEHQKRVVKLQLRLPRE